MESVAMAAYPASPNLGIHSNNVGGISNSGNVDSTGSNTDTRNIPDYDSPGHVSQSHRMHVKPYKLEIRQQPATARVAIGKVKDRKPIDPPPIVQVSVALEEDPHQNYLQNPYLLMTTRLRKYIEGAEPDHVDAEVNENVLLGTIVSSLYNLKDTNNQQGGFFVFGDLSCRLEGLFRLEFILYEIKMDTRRCVLLTRVYSDKFEVFASKSFPGMQESTFLTRLFSDQGVRLRLRKDSRSITTRKRKFNVAHLARDLDRHDRNEKHMQQHNGRRSNSYPEATTAALGPSRGSFIAQGSAYYDQGPRADYEDGIHSGFFPHYTEDGRVLKRRRPNEHALATHVYGPHDFSYPALRTLQDAASLGMSSASGGGYAMGVQNSILPQPPTPGYPTPRIDTQMSPQSGLLSAPNSAATTFSPGPRRSPGTVYHVRATPPSAIFASPTTTLPYHTAVSVGQNGLSLDMPPHSHVGELGSDGKH